MACKRRGPPPKGELWLGSDLLRAAGLEDDLEGHTALASHLGQHLVSFPVSEDPAESPDLGYRWFSPEDLAEASARTDLLTTALISGPFQRLSEKKGLMEVLYGWIREREGLLEAYSGECGRVEALIEECLRHCPGAVVVADDLAGDTGPFLRPSDMEEHFFGFYSRVAVEIRKGGAWPLFHSCGDIRKLIPGLLSCGFQGLAGIEHRANDLVSLRRGHGASFSLMGGIDAALLESERLSPDDLSGYKELVRAFSRDQGLILCSSSGLYSGRFFTRILELYETADREWEEVNKA